jgi:DNA modification methylase
MSNALIIVGDNRQTLKTLAAQSVQTVITSPPYWGLRDYGTATWIGGDESCTHRRESKYSENTATGHAKSGLEGIGDAIYKDVCPRCGAKREDDQIGLEVSPEDYVEQLCLVFDEVWRVLKDDGTLWLNLGDTYVGSGSKGSLVDPKQPEGRNGQAVAMNNKVSGLKPKDMIGIPWRVALALQARGWYLRQDIIWAKPNPMPEPVLDRCTKSHEYIFLMSKSPKYYFDNKAIAEPASRENEKQILGGKKSIGRTYGKDDPNNRNGHEQMGREIITSETRNKRDVWTVAPSRYKEAHFATYPPELILPCVLAASKADDLILDPFSGSGTTGEVAMSQGRNYLGLELNPDYALMSEKRLTDACGLFGTVEVRNG